MKLKFAALCAPIAMLAACGGGDSAPPPTGGGGPTPSPSPSPSPTPSISYTAFDDLTGDQVFNTACAEGIDIQRTNTIALFDEDFTFAFAAASETWTIAGESREGPINTSFGPADITEEDPGVLVLYQRPSPTGGPSEIFAFGTPQWPNADPQYVRGAFLQSERDNGSVASFNCVFGVPTDLNDELPTSTVTYNQESEVFGSLLEITGPAGNEIFTSYDLAPTTMTVSADPTTLEVSFDIDLRGFEVTFDATTGDRIVSTDVTSFGVYTGEAFVSDEGKQTLRGGNLFRDGAVQLFAPATGWFFGPQGEEIGLVFTATEDIVPGGVRSFSFGMTGRQDP